MKIANSKGYMVKYKLVGGSNYVGSYTFKDGTKFQFDKTRAEIAQFMYENKKPRAIDDDPDKLVANFVALAERLHNKEVKAKKRAEREALGIPHTLGGKRPNSGRKSKGGTENLRYSFRVSRDVWDILQRQTNKTAYIEEAIRFYAERED